MLKTKININNKRTLIKWYIFEEGKWVVIDEGMVNRDKWYQLVIMGNENFEPCCGCPPPEGQRAWLEVFEPERPVNNIVAEYSLLPPVDEVLVGAIYLVAAKINAPKWNSFNFVNGFENLPYDVPYNTVFKVIEDGFYVDIPLDNTFSTALNNEQVILNDFVKAETDKVINPIINMEKVLYTPCYINDKYDENTIYRGGDTISGIEIIGEREITIAPLKEVDTIKFNFHFRDRFLYNTTDGYKKDIDGEYVFTNKWLTQDGVFWNGYELVAPDAESLSPRLGLVSNHGDEQSDLLGYLGFETDDVRFQKDKIRKTFIRLSFYDSIDPRKQNLLYYSTIFMNSSELFDKYVNNTTTKGYVNIFDKVTVDSNNVYSGISVNYEYNPMGSSVSAFDLDETKRLSTQITVRDRYNSLSSSEGFYLYLFSQNAPKIQPETIYMKVEFNHAGNGRTIPFMLPVDENYNPISIMSTDFPFRGFLEKDETGNERVNMEKYYKSIFIELKVVYDSITGKYVWFLPQGMGDKNDRTIVLNLFEAKVQ